jgi:hypothetical protein
MFAFEVSHMRVLQKLPNAIVVPAKREVLAAHMAKRAVDKGVHCVEQLAYGYVEPDRF